MKAVLKCLQAVFLVLCIGYLAYALYHEGDAISGLFLQAKPGFLFPALLLWPFGILVSGCFAFQVIKSTGDATRYRDVLAIYLNRIPAKYLPGGIWQTLARAYDLNGLGMEKSRIAILVFYENFWTVLLAAGISSLLLISGDRTGIYADLAFLMLGGIILLIPTAYIFRRNAFVLKARHYVEITVTCLFFWCVAGGSFILYLMAFDNALFDQSVLDLFTNYLFAYVIGFISIFTPQGVGVFEFVMTQLTNFSIVQTQALILIAGFRIIVLMGDMIAWFLFLLASRSGFFRQSGEPVDTKG